MGRFLGPNVLIPSSGIFGGATAIPAGTFIVVAANSSNPNTASGGGSAIRDNTGTWHKLDVSALGARGLFGAQRDSLVQTRWVVSTNVGGGNGLIGIANDTSPTVSAVDTGIADSLSDISIFNVYLIGTLENQVVYSTDLVHFTAEPAHGPGSYTITGICNLGPNSVCIGISSGNTNICTSPDGITWTNNAALFSTGPDSQVTANTIINDGTHYVAVGGGSLATSPDGGVWTITAFTHTGTATCIGYDFGNSIGNYYVGDQAGNVLVSSTLAGLATAAAVNISPNPLRCATTTNGVALLGDDHGNVYRSSDGGVTWHTENPGLGALILTAMANSTLA